MPSVNGIIEVVSIKPLDNPDKYGNTFRASLKIGEDWYSFGSLKKDVINVKDGSGWTQVTKGMEVEFMFKENGSFKNVQKASFSITDKSNAQAAPAPSQQASKPQQQQSNGKEYVNPQSVGACLNLAVQVLGYTKKDFEDENKLRAAIAWHKGTFAKLMDMYADVDAATPSKPKPKPKSAPVEDKPPFDEDLDMDYDDDLPI
jgi:hypothetical protein